jgi:hypothetical protein
VSAPDQWTTLWPQTLVTPVFVGGPADGKRDEPRQRWRLPLRIEVPVMPRLAVAYRGVVAGPLKALLEVNDPYVEVREVNFGVHVYRLGPYRDAFTVEYR